MMFVRVGVENMAPRIHCVRNEIAVELLSFNVLYSNLYSKVHTCLYIGYIFQSLHCRALCMPRFPFPRDRSTEFILNTLAAG